MNKDYKIIENDLIPVMEDSKGKKLVNARQLHEFLEVGDKFATWIRRKIEQYGFIENVDYIPLSQKCEGNNSTRIDYILTMDTAKEMAMVQNNEKGKQARLYFIAVEKKHKQLVNCYKPKATSLGEVASVMKECRIVMKAQRTPPYKIAKQQKLIMEHFGIPVIKDFVQEPVFMQITMTIPIE